MGCSTAALAVALVALLPRPGWGQTYGLGPDLQYVTAPEHPIPLWLNPPKEAAVASCTIDVGISTAFLGMAGTNMNAAVRFCTRQRTDKDKAACSASVSGVVEGLGYAAGFLAEAAADCERSFQIVNVGLVAKAACAADSANLLASLALVASSASSMRDACGTDHLLARPLDTRRLEESGPERLFHQLGAREGAGHNATSVERVMQQIREKIIIREHTQFPGEASADQLKHRAGEIAECVFDVGKATFFLARAGLMVNAAVADCSRFELRTGGSHARATCAVDVSSVISAFAFTSSGIAFAAYHCSFWKHLKPACAGAVSELIAALAQIAASGASFEGTCGYRRTPLPRRTSSVGEESSDVLV